MFVWSCLYECVMMFILGYIIENIFVSVFVSECLSACSVCRLLFMPTCFSPLHIFVSVCIMFEYLSHIQIPVSSCVMCLNPSSSSRETTVMKKTSVPSAPTGLTTGGCDDGDASTPQWTSFACLTVPPHPKMCLCVMSVTSMTSAPSIAPAVPRAKDTEMLLPAPQPPQLLLPAPQTTTRPAGAPPAAPPQTRHRPLTPLSVDPHPLVEVVEDHPPWFWRLKAASQTNHPGRRAPVCWERWRNWGWGGQQASFLLFTAEAVTAGACPGMLPVGQFWSKRRREWRGCTARQGEDCGSKSFRNPRGHLKTFTTVRAVICSVLKHKLPLGGH